jgi:hypothetical protein
MYVLRDISSPGFLLSYYLSETQQTCLKKGFRYFKNIRGFILIRNQISSVFATEGSSLTGVFVTRESFWMPRSHLLFLKKMLCVIFTGAIAHKTDCGFL